MHRFLIVVTLALAACAGAPLKRTAVAPSTAPVITDSSGTPVLASVTVSPSANAVAMRKSAKMGATASGGSEVGSFPNASALNGSERMLADQNATTVNITPTQIGQFLGITSQITFPLALGNGGTGAATAAQALLNLLPSPITPLGCLQGNSAGNNVQWATNCGGSGAVASVSAGPSGTLTCSPTTGAVQCDVSQAGALSFVGNATTSPAAPVSINGQQAQATLVASNFNYCAASPSTGPINDYTPACATGTWGSTMGVLNITPPTGGITLDGLVAGSNMQAVNICNAESSGGTDPIIIENQSSSDSTPANRFSTVGTLVILPGSCKIAIYTTPTILRWVM